MALALALTPRLGDLVMEFKFPDLCPSANSALMPQLISPLGNSAVPASELSLLLKVLGYWKDQLIHNSGEL
jgi:hypothetical protein